MLVNGNDQPVRVSKIEVLENISVNRATDMAVKVIEQKSAESQAADSSDPSVAVETPNTTEIEKPPAVSPVKTVSTPMSSTPITNAVQTNIESEKSKIDEKQPEKEIEKEIGKDQGKEKKMLDDKAKGKGEKSKEKDSTESSIVTADYIQQSMFSFVHAPFINLFQSTNISIFSAIQNALRQGNLNPEIEEKLLNLQRCHEKQMKGVQRPTSVALANNHHEYTSPVKYSSTSRKHSASRPIDTDGDWVMDTPKRRPPRTTSFSEKGKAQNAAVVENDVNRIIRSVAEESVGGGSAAAAAAAISDAIPTTKSPAKVESRTPIKRQNQIVPSPIKRTVTTPIKNVVTNNEPKAASHAVNEISPNKRTLTQTKKDNEKKKQMQVSHTRSNRFC